MIQKMNQCDDQNFSVNCKTYKSCIKNLHRLETVEIIHSENAQMQQLTQPVIVIKLFYKRKNKLTFEIYNV